MTWTTAAEVWEIVGVPDRIKCALGWHEWRRESTLVCMHLMSDRYICRRCYCYHPATPPKEIDHD